jgi:hypothetical protein
MHEVSCLTCTCAMSAGRASSSCAVDAMHAEGSWDISKSASVSHANQSRRPLDEDERMPGGGGEGEAERAGSTAGWNESSSSRGGGKGGSRGGASCCISRNAAERAGGRGCDGT